MGCPPVGKAMAEDQLSGRGRAAYSSPCRACSRGSEAAELASGGRTDGAVGAFLSRYRVLTAVGCVLLVMIAAFSIYLPPVSAKNATALTPPGTGGIMATKALLRSELPFTLRSATARSHFDEAEKALSEGKFAEAARLYEISGEAVDTLAAKLNFGIALYNTSDLPKAASIFSAGLEIARKK